MKLSSGIAVIGIFVAFISANCGRPANVVNPELDAEMPRKILWAWERAEDLSFIDPNEYGAAFLAQTIFLENDRVIPKPRRQPFSAPDGTYLIAVTRVETNKEQPKRPTFDDEMLSRLAGLIAKTAEMPNIRGVQVDFDATVSERDFYRKLINAVRERTPEGVALSITALASWCAGDSWFNDFPIDEAVPMVFVMGRDQESILSFLRRGDDWREPLCRGSYGISVDEPAVEGLQPNRRIYYFKNSAWAAADLK
ncbi:MAG: DUF3142 domain-containing protein [Acidobacteria bacterium]|nr:DUF3142 domain-containing protein [Acidobacteriota bacterium]